MAPIESRIIKRKRDNGPDPSEKERKNLKLPLDDVNVSPVIKDTCGLLRLPKELLDVVFQELDIVQVFVLGLQTRYLWNVAWTHIQAYRASSCGSWAGKGIICVGDYLEPADYPPDLLTKIEKEELQKGFDNSELRDDDTSDEDSTDFVSSPTNLYHLAAARYQQVREWPDSLARELLAEATLLGEWHRLPTSRRTLIRDDLTRYQMSDLYPEDQPWILRNLTTHEYVRSEAIAIKPEYIHGPNIDVLGFGEVVWSRICWSTATDRSTEYTDNIHRGSWAGHRFDITTLDRHRQATLDRTEWKDVSEEVANEVEKIWCEGFGSDWRDKIQEWR